VAYVPDDRATAPVRLFGPYTPDLDALLDGLATCRMETVTIALTSVTCIAVSEILETRSFCVSLVHARQHTLELGRKSAVQDGQWIPSLPPCSRLRGVAPNRAVRVASLCGHSCDDLHNDTHGVSQAPISDFLSCSEARG
jgi:hypothetical protein